MATASFFISWLFSFGLNPTFNESTAAATAVPQIEVVFALDSTGSMSEEIQEAKEKILSIAEAIRSGDPQPQVRFRVVTYRDKGDEYVTREWPFSDNSSVTQKILSEIRADNGGDNPESVIEALHLAIRQTPWTMDEHVMKIVYLIGDAGPHYYDDTPDVDEDLQWALQHGIVVHSIGCIGLEGNSRSFFEKAALATEGRYYGLREGKVANGAAVANMSADLSDADLASDLPTKEDLGAVVSSSARSYSGEVGVTYAQDAEQPVFFLPLAGADLERPTGLLGEHGLAVHDATTWRMLWLAHTSLRPSPPAPLPEVDFTKQQVLAIWSATGSPRLDALASQGSSLFFRYHVIAGAPDAAFFMTASDDRPVRFETVEEDVR